MIDNSADPTDAVEDGKSQGDKGQAQGASTTQANESDLRLKVAELERDNKKYRDEKRAQELTLKKQQDEQLAKDQKWQELATSQAADLEKLKPVAQQYEVITSAFNEMLEGQLKQVPEDIRKRVIDPVRATMDPVAFSKWMRDNLDTFRARTAPNLNAGEGSGANTSGNNMFTQQELEMIRATGIKPEEWLKQKTIIAQQQAEQQ